MKYLRTDFEVTVYVLCIHSSYKNLKRNRVRVVIVFKDTSFMV